MFGAGLMALAGAALIAIRPADKAAQNETDAKKYLAILARAPHLSDAEMECAMTEAGQSDCQEIEPLRDVAFNDVVTEFGRDDAKVKLNLQQVLLAALA